MVSVCVCVRESTENICHMGVNLYGCTLILGWPCSSCVSSSSRFIQACLSHGDGGGARASKTECAKLLQASSCITSANIPLASHMAEYRVTGWSKLPYSLEGIAKLHGGRKGTDTERSEELGQTMQSTTITTIYPCLGSQSFLFCPFSCCSDSVSHLIASIMSLFG